jgi:hypothetical protein
MLIPLGIWAASGAGSVAAVPAYELISTTILGVDTAGVTFSSIPSTYKHLELRMVTSRTSGGAACQIGIRLNGDTASNYSSHRLYTDQNGSVVSNSTLTTYIDFIAYGNQIANVRSGHIASISDYANTTTNKTVRILGGVNYNPNGIIALDSGSYRSTSAITSIDLITLGLNFVATSRFSLYGIKG